LASDAGAGE
jgi:hypothetical protein